MPTSFSPRGDAVTALFADEATYGVAPSGNWAPFTFYTHSLEEKQPFGDDNLLGQTQNNNRDVNAPEPGLPGLAGDIDVPLDLAYIGIWLRQVFGAPTSSGSSPNYTHVFTSGLEVLPHRSIEIKQNTGLYYWYSGLFGQKLSFQANYAAGYEHVTASLMGRKETKGASSLGGTPTALAARSPVPRAIAVLKLGGTLVGSISAVKADYDNGAVPQKFIGDSYPQGHDLDGMAKFGGSITARFRDATLYDLAKAQSAQSLELLWQSSNVRSLSLLSTNCRLEPAGIPVKGPGGIEAAFNFRGEQSAGAPMLTATLKSPTQTF